MKKLLVFTAFIFCFAVGWQKVFGQQSIPNNILATLNPSHSRLMVNGLSAFAAINKNATTDSFLRLSVANLIRCADSLLQVPGCTYTFLDSYRMDTRDVYYRCYCLSMAYRLTGNKNYVDRLWKNLDAASKFLDWKLNGKRLVAEIISPANAVFEIKDAVPLPSSPNPIENDKNKGITKLSVHLTTTNTTTTIAIQFKEESK